MQGGATVRGDRNAEWRDSYGAVRKDVFAAAQRTNRRRLRSMGVRPPLSSGTWLDLGAGDGNVARTLHELGACHVVALEYQPELARQSPSGCVPVVGSAEQIPLVTASVQVAVVMDVLHHLRADQLQPCLDELHRVLVADGTLLVCEPAPTVVRRVLGVALMSPAASWWSFSRHKRRMVELEADTLEPWLSGEHRFVAQAGHAGFVLERTARRPLHTLRRFRRGTGPSAPSR